MKKVYDKNGELIAINDRVIVPEPNEEDLFNNEFVGAVIEILPDGYVVVQDQDFDTWTIEPERLEIIIE
jgi:hypothetical protein